MLEGKEATKKREKEKMELAPKTPERGNLLVRLFDFHNKAGQPGWVGPGRFRRKHFWLRSSQYKDSRGCV